MTKQYTEGRHEITYFTMQCSCGLTLTKVPKSENQSAQDFAFGLNRFLNLHEAIADGSVSLAEGLQSLSDTEGRE